MDSGQIILIPFPFTDLSSSKVRPALVLSNTSLIGNDIIICAITSKKSGCFEVEIDNDNLENGSIPTTSYIKVNKIATLESRMIKQTVAKVSKELFNKVMIELSSIIG